MSWDLKGTSFYIIGNDENGPILEVSPEPSETIVKVGDKIEDGNHYGFSSWGAYMSAYGCNVSSLY